MFIVALAFVAGCSVLVRPELALIGGLALIMMLIAAQGWRRRVVIVVAGGLLPVGYQIFRMGYYGLLFPGTALAKDAGRRQVVAGPDLPVELQRALRVVGAGVAAGGAGPGVVGFGAAPVAREPARRRQPVDRWPARCRARPPS